MQTLNVELAAYRSTQDELRETRNAAVERMNEAITRAEKAESELAAANAILTELQELHGCSREMVGHWCENAAQRSLGLGKVQGELAQTKADWRASESAWVAREREWVQGISAVRNELAAERAITAKMLARFVWLNSQVSAYGTEETHEGNTWHFDGAYSFLEDLADAEIDAAMKEGAK
jgi:hypothetical protein